MPRVKMVANRKFSYAARVLKPGERFEADQEADANVLTLSGHARRDTEEDKQRYRRRDMRAEE